MGVRGGHPVAIKVFFKDTPVISGGPKQPPIIASQLKPPNAGRDPSGPQRILEGGASWKTSFGLPVKNRTSIPQAKYGWF